MVPLCCPSDLDQAGTWVKCGIRPRSNQAQQHPPLLLPNTWHRWHASLLTFVITVPDLADLDLMNWPFLKTITTSYGIPLHTLIAHWTEETLSLVCPEYATHQFHRLLELLERKLNSSQPSFFLLFKRPQISAKASLDYIFQANSLPFAVSQGYRVSAGTHRL